MDLWDRKYSIRVEDILISNLPKPGETKADPGLDIIFDVTKTLGKDPNTLDLTIFNLNEDHRSQLAQVEKPFVQLEAGYADGISLIFKGQTRTAVSYKDGPDWITEFHSGDAEQALTNSRINKSYKKGTPLGTIIEDLVSAIDVGKGNIQLRTALAKWTHGGRQTINGLVVSGSCKEELTGILESMGMEWSIQDNEMQILQTGKPIEGVAYVLSAETGMIGTPTIGSENELNVAALLIGTIVPGSVIVIISQTKTKVGYRVETANYIGDLAGNDWYVQIEAKEL